MDLKTKCSLLQQDVDELLEEWKDRRWSTGKVFSHEVVKILEVLTRSISLLEECVRKQEED